MLKIGDKLKAIDTKFSDLLTEALILDKEYEIIDLYIHDLVIESEVDNRHFFSLRENENNYYKNFFIEI